ncbi:hypothetical protein F5Y19DRAFT_330736 [Xylariaceae sp. FL1651]|nr:hypothetical protein F5Y19DRAFT_330736 [Xylariaceae sp. FL1651]
MGPPIRYPLVLMNTWFIGALLGISDACYLLAWGGVLEKMIPQDGENRKFHYSSTTILNVILQHSSLLNLATNSVLNHGCFGH